MLYNYTYQDSNQLLISDFATQPEKVVDAQRQLKFFGNKIQDCQVTLEFKAVGMHGDRFIGKWKVKNVLIVF